MPKVGLNLAEKKGVDTQSMYYLLLSIAGKENLREQAVEKLHFTSNQDSIQ